MGQNRTKCRDFCAKKCTSLKKSTLLVVTNISYGDKVTFRAVLESQLTIDVNVDVDKNAKVTFSFSLSRIFIIKLDMSPKWFNEGSFPEEIMWDVTYAGHHPNQCFCWGSTKLAQLSGGPFKAIKPTEDLARKENSRCKLSRQGGRRKYFSHIHLFSPLWKHCQQHNWCG